MDTNAITTRIDSMLKEKGISKQEFYAACKISSSAYSQWNTGKTTPRDTTMQRIAEYLGCSYEYLKTGIGEKRKTSTNSSGRQVSDDDIKFALFGGDGEITDAMFEEVKRFAHMVKLREEAEKKEEQ